MSAPITRDDNPILGLLDASNQAEKLEAAS